MKRILITGCQRSGTTLMGLIMDSHPLIKNVDEADFKSINDLSTEFHSCAKLPQVSANIDYIKNEFKPDVVIWMVRNPFDVVKSMLSLQVKRSRSVTESWASTFSHIEISRVLQYLPNEVFAEYNELLTQYRSVLGQVSIRDSDHGMIVAAATCWVLKQLGVIALRDAGVNVHIVRYEDLLLKPEPVIRGIADKIGLKYHKNMLRHHELHRGVSIGETINNRAIDKANMFTAGTFFNQKEIKLIDSLSSNMSKVFYYPNGEEDTVLLQGKSPVILSSDMKYFSWNLFLLESSRNNKNANEFLFYFDSLKEQFSERSFVKWLFSAHSDQWVAEVLSNHINTDVVLKLFDAINKTKDSSLIQLFTSILNDSELWKLYFCWKGELNYKGPLEDFYNVNTIMHPKFAAAIAGVIARQGSVLYREEQWDFLVALNEKFPKVKSIRVAASSLINTLPANKNVSDVLLKWNGSRLTKSAYQQLLYGLTTREFIDFSKYEVDDFEITNIDTLYMAWRLGRFEQIESLHQDTSMGECAKMFSANDNAEDFNGRDHFYVGPETPKKLVVAFTGFASMLMHPPALIHELIDLPEDSGVLWLQDVNSRGYMAGPKGDTGPYDYEDYIGELIKSKGAKQVSVIGSSIGGTISLHYASVASIYRSVALSPYTKLGDIEIPDRLQEKFGQLFAGVPDLFCELGDNYPETRIYYGNLCDRDREDALRFGKLPKVELVPIEDSKEHNIGGELANKGLYAEIFNWLLQS